MLSYKEYKLLNESLYGAFNLGLKGPTTVGGIVSGSPINGTAAAEEAIEEAKKAKKMKKKMDGEMEDSEEDEDDEVVDKVDASDKEDEDEEDHDEEDSEDEGDDDEDSEDEDEDSEEDEKPAPDMEKKDFAFMKKKMKKKSKKEWSDFMSDLESMLEAVDDEEALMEVKKGLEMMKKGMEKGMKKGMDCGCKKKCGKYMNEEEQKWWNSVNSMVNSDPNHKAWDGWSEVGEVQQAVREEVDQKKNSKLNEGIWDSSPSPDYHGKPGALKRLFVSPSNSLHKSLEKAIDNVKAAYLREDPRAPELEEDLYRTYTDHPDGGGHMMFSRQQLRSHLWDSPSEGNGASLKAAMRDLGLDVPSHATHGYGHPGFDRDGNMLSAPDREWEKPGNTWNKGSAR